MKTYSRSRLSVRAPSYLGPNLYHIKDSDEFALFVEEDIWDIEASVSLKSMSCHVQKLSERVGEDAIITFRSPYLSWGPPECDFCSISLSYYRELTEDERAKCATLSKNHIDNTKTK